MGWQKPREDELPHREALFELAVGEVSDPIPGPGGFFIYKVEEERLEEKPEDAAAYVGYTVNTLAQFRSKKKGPVFHKMPGRYARVLYAIEDLDNWIATRAKVVATS